MFRSSPSTGVGRRPGPKPGDGDDDDDQQTDPVIETVADYSLRVLRDNGAPRIDWLAYTEPDDAADADFERQQIVATGEGTNQLRLRITFRFRGDR